MNAMRDIARARPLLGTIVAIRVAGLPETAAIAAVECAFAEIGSVHRCMSFHERDSDLSKLHRANGAAIDVDPRTYEVLQRAIGIARESDGVFDPGIAAQLVGWNLLPEPENAQPADAEATWRDIELHGDGRVRLCRPLWIDLGGIAKGFAVDRALAILRAHGCASASVNAGGDLARFGPEAELVVIDPKNGGDRTAIELADRAIASSSGAPLSTRVRGRWRGAHVHGRKRHAVGVLRSVSVVAASCCVADALTKVVLADLRVGEKLLRRHGARAYLFDEMRGWRTLGAA